MNRHKLITIGVTKGAGKAIAVVPAVAEQLKAEHQQHLHDLAWEQGMARLKEVLRDR